MPKAKLLIVDLTGENLTEEYQRQDSLRFNFKNWVFFNERLSMVGEDQAVMKREGNRYQLESPDVRFVYLDVGHTY